MSENRWRSVKTSQSGQAAVESAIILPLYVFLVLGILQLGLMHQARLVTKYAAYKAVRAGSLHNARKVAMERAALAVLLPLVSRDAGGGEFIKSVNSAADFQGKWSWPGVMANRMMDVGLPYAQVTVCGPSRKEIRGNLREVDFDDPRYAAGTDWLSSHLTKLRVQVTFNYRMPIPFANQIIHAAASGREIPELMRMGNRGVAASRDLTTPLYTAAAARGVYVLPIRASYTMRMQSNLYVSQLPDSNTCYTTNRY